jgi:hypothetical protein
MPRWSYICVAFLLTAPSDVPHGSSLRTTSSNTAQQGATLPTLSDIFLSVTGNEDSKQSTLAVQERLQIVRFVDGEFAKAVRPLPADKKGFRYEARATINDKDLDKEISSHGLAARPGDTVQITNVIFREKEIVVEINGGPRHHGSWRNHVQVRAGVGGMGTGTGAPPPASRPPGAMLILDYGKTLPDMSPDDLKKDLSVFLDFANQRSPATQWVDTLPPEFRQAIKEQRAVVGMNPDMVLAALGHPDKKVRETNDNGEETEDWIYGHPPAKTIFVTFLNDKVTQVKQYP